MVLVKKKALNDIQSILNGLLTWNKHQLSYDFCINYVDRIIETCFEIKNVVFHKKATYLTHKMFGVYIYDLKSNRHTTWYIIYNIDSMNNILVERIISNYVTIE
jgi:hypothetical protein